MRSGEPSPAPRRPCTTSTGSITDMRGRIEDGRCHFQVTLKVGFRLDEPPA
jgi:hypothetical protein